MEVDFYHLTTTPLDRVLPPIVERVLAGGARLKIIHRPSTGYPDGTAGTAVG